MTQTSQRQDDRARLFGWVAEECEAALPPSGNPRLRAYIIRKMIRRGWIVDPLFRDLLDSRHHVVREIELACDEQWEVDAFIEADEDRARSACKTCGGGGCRHCLE